MKTINPDKLIEKLKIIKKNYHDKVAEKGHEGFAAGFYCIGELITDDLEKAIKDSIEETRTPPVCTQDSSPIEPGPMLFRAHKQIADEAELTRRSQITCDALNFWEEHKK